MRERGLRSVLGFVHGQADDEGDGVLLDSSKVAIVLSEKNVPANDCATLQSLFPSSFCVILPA
jgi:hypothetical protein